MADLVSSQVLQKTLDELRNITRIDLCVTNTDGVLLVTTFPLSSDYKYAYAER